MQKLSSYIKKASPDYAFRIVGDIEKSLVEKKLADLQIGSFVESQQGGFDITLGYPISGSDLLGRLCALGSSQVIVHEGDKVYSNKPLAQETPVVEQAQSDTVEETVEPAQVYEIRHTSQEEITTALGEMSNNIQGLFSQEISSLREEISSIRNNDSDTQRHSLLESRLDGLESNLKSVIESLGPRLDAMLTRIEENNMLVNETVEKYHTKLTEMALSQSKINQKVHKEVKRDSNGFIVEVIESIIPEA